MRRGVLILAVIAALVGAPSAFAFQDVIFEPGVSPPRLVPAANEYLRDSANTGTTPHTTTVYDQARRKSRIHPGLRSVGTIAVAVGTATVIEKAWRMEIPGQGAIYKLVTGEAFVSAPAMTFAPQWEYNCNDGGNEGAAMADAGIPLTPGSSTQRCAWLLRGGGLASGAYGANSTHTAAVNCSTTAHNNWAAFAFSYPTSLYGSTGTVFSNCGTGGWMSYHRVRTEAQMEAGSKAAPMTATEYSAHPTKVDSGTYTMPGDQGTIEDRTAGAEPFAEPANEEAAQELCHRIGGTEIDCGSAPPPALLTLPAPGILETAAQYRSRLQALGWLGTITILTSPYIYPRVSPSTVVKVEFGPAPPTVIPVFDPAMVPAPWTQGDQPAPTDQPPYEPWPQLPPEWMPTPEPWPSPLPNALSTTPVTIIRQPPAAPSADTFPADPGGTGSGGPGGGIDFSPLVPGAFCDKFPFGVVCWIAEQIEVMFLQEELAPHLTIDFPGITVGNTTFDLPAYTADAAVLSPGFDGFRGLVRAILGFLLWLGGLWILGRRLLGVKGAEALEEATT